MPDSTTPKAKLTLMLDAADHERLARLAQARGQSVEEFVAGSALREVEWDEEFRAAVQRGLEDIRHGRVLSEQEMDRIFDELTQ